MQEQDYRSYAIRSAAALTASYVAGTVIKDIQLQNQINLYIDFTVGALTEADIKIEFSQDNSTYYQETSQSVSSGIATETLEYHKLTATGKYIITLPVKSQFVKISSKGNAADATSSLAIVADVGIV